MSFSASSSATWPLPVILSLPPSKEHTLVSFGSVYFREKGLKALSVLWSPGASSFSFGLWITELSSSKDSFVSKSLFNPIIQKSELLPSHLGVPSSPHSPDLCAHYTS